MIFCFGGRRENLELQLPLVRRVLSENAGVQYHLWNLTKTADDDAYIRSVAGDRITVINDLQGPDPFALFPKVFKHYAQPAYSSTHFVKIDDDVVFFETEGFRGLVEGSKARPNGVVSARVFNNGACGLIEPDLRALHDRFGASPLEVGYLRRYADLSHDAFLNDWRRRIRRSGDLVEVQEWLAINLISFNWQTVGAVANAMGTIGPTTIARRHFPSNPILGDEQAVNIGPRWIYPGLAACHLSFGPQRFADAELNALRDRYREVGREYLAEISGAELSGVGS